MRLIMITVTLLIASNAFAVNVYWGGVSFSDWENRDSKFPQLASMMCSGSCPAGHLNSWALQALNQASFERFSVSMDYIDGRQIEGVIMTPMINAETLSVYRDVTNSKESFIHVYRVYASLVFFEFGSKRFISARPVVMQYTDTRAEPASEKQRREAFQSLVEPGGSKTNLFSELFASASDVQPFSFSEKYARISKIEISKEAQDVLTSIANPDAWRDQIKRQFEAFLIDSTDAPLVPSMGSDDMTAEFVATFADASVTINMPSEVPFAVEVTIENFKKIERRARRQKTLCHAVAVRLKVAGLLSDLMNQRLVRGRQSCNVVTLQKKPDDSYYFTLSLLSLLKQAADQFNETPDKEFLSGTTEDSPEAEEGFVRAWQTAFKPEI